MITATMPVITHEAMTALLAKTGTEIELTRAANPAAENM